MTEHITLEEAQSSFAQWHARHYFATLVYEENEHLLVEMKKMFGYVTGPQSTPEEMRAAAAEARERVATESAPFLEFRPALTWLRDEAAWRVSFYEGWLISYRLSGQQ